MKTHLRHFWETLNSSYWFLPTVMLVGAAAAAFMMLWLDRHLFETPQGIRWAYTGGVDGARALLSTVASSTITVAGVVFSITIATLTQASSQFGPRLLRNFMRDTGNQVVLGTFVATFIYSLLVLRTIHGEEDAAFVPHLSVTGAVVLAAASLGVLIYFIHHVSDSIQAPNVIANVADDLEQAMSRMYPEGLGEEGPEPGTEGVPPLPPDLYERARVVPSPSGGYLQAIDSEGVLTAAVEHDLLLVLPVRPGEYVVQRNPLVLAYPPERVDDALAERLAEAFLLGRRRTPEQDVEFAIHQMVEIAVRALSPGINDPYTAMTAVDRLASALADIARRDLHAPWRYDGDPDDGGRLRIVADVSNFGGFVDAAFNQIRQYGRTSASVNIRLLEAIAAIAGQMKADVERAALRRQATMIHRQAMELPEEQDRRDAQDRYERALTALGGDGLAGSAPPPTAAARPWAAPGPTASTTAPTGNGGPERPRP